MKASQNSFQSNEMTESKFSAPIMLRSGKRIQSILQWTLPQDRPFRKQPSPAQATATTQMIPRPVMGQYRFAVRDPGSYYEDSGYPPQQIAPGSPLEVSTPGRL